MSPIRKRFRTHPKTTALLAVCGVFLLVGELYFDLPFHFAGIWLFGPVWTAWNSGWRLGLVVAVVVGSVFLGRALDVPRPYFGIYLLLLFLGGIVAAVVSSIRGASRELRESKAPPATPAAR